MLCDIINRIMEQSTEIRVNSVAGTHPYGRMCPSTYIFLCTHIWPYFEIYIRVMFAFLLISFYFQSLRNTRKLTSVSAHTCDDDECKTYTDAIHSPTPLHCSFSCSRSGLLNSSKKEAEEIKRMCLLVRAQEKFL